MNYAPFFSGIKTIAVVGLSDDPARYSYQVAEYLLKNGFEIIPVNPNIRETLGRKSYAALDEVKEKIDAVDIFRKSEFVPAIVDDAIRLGIKHVWMQEGVSDDASAKKARDHGITVVMNMCMMKEHKKLGNG